MCNPAGMMMAMTVMQAANQQMQAKDARNAAAEREAQARQAAHDKAMLEEEQLQQSLVEARDSAETDKFEAKRESALKAGKIMAGRSEAGALGNALFSELQENMMHEGLDVSTIDYNYRNKLKNAELSRKAIHLNMNNTINANKAPSHNSFLSGLQIATAGAKGAMQGYSMGSAMEDAFSADGTAGDWSGVNDPYNG